MSDNSLSPYIIVAIGVFLFYLGLRAVRKKKIMGSQGTDLGLKNPEYYFKVLISFLGSILIFFWAGREFHQAGGWLNLSFYVIVLAGIIWWLIRFNKIKTAAKEGIKQAMIPRVYRKIQTDSPNMWSMAAIAMLTRVKGRKYTLLGGEEPGPSSLKYAKKRLKNEWDIRDAEDFNEIQDWLLTVGHRAEFHDLIEKIMNSSHAEIQQYLGEVDQGEHGISNKIERQEEHFRVKMIQEQGSMLKNQGFLAWDQLRYIENCGLGYLAGYLDEETTWENINSVAQVLQSRYDSWEDLGDAYLMAREFWSVVDFKKTGKTYEKVFSRLLTDKKSPWNQIAWDMSLIPKSE